MKLQVLKQFNVSGGYIVEAYNPIHRAVLYYGYLDDGRILGFNKDYAAMAARIERYQVTKQVEEDSCKHVPLSVVHSHN